MGGSFVTMDLWVNLAVKMGDSAPLGLVKIKDGQKWPWRSPVCGQSMQVRTLTSYPYMCPWHGRSQAFCGSLQGLGPSILPASRGPTCRTPRLDETGCNVIPARVGLCCSSRRIFVTLPHPPGPSMHYLRVCFCSLSVRSHLAGQQVLICVLCGPTLRSVWLGWPGQELLLPPV